MSNQKTIDVAYFRDKLTILLRDIDHYARSSEDLARVLTRLAVTSDEHAAKAEMKIGWRPIKTTPKDKTILLLTEYGDVISGQWGFEDRDDPGQWFGWQEPLDQKATHWMPTPPAPQEQQQ